MTIDRENVIRDLENLGAWHTHHYAPFHYEAAETIHNALVLLREQEPQPAKWLWDRPHHFKCSNCEWFAGVSATMYSFCPNCGRKMEMTVGELRKEWPNAEVVAYE